VQTGCKRFLHHDSFVAGVAQRLIAQLHQTALIVNDGTEAPAARTVPQVEWKALLAVRCSALFGCC
jgi:hypothetical protein